MRACKELVVLGLPGCLPSGLVGLVDLFSLLPTAAARAALPSPDVRVRVAGVDGWSFEDGRGRTMAPDASVEEISRADAILLPGFLTELAPLEGQASGWEALFRWLRRQHERGALVLASCAGTYILGRAGLLDGRRCTTTWWLHDALSRRFPRGDWAYGAPLLEDDRVVTAGGPLSWIDVGLAAVRATVGAAHARALADYAVLGAVPVVQGGLAPAGAWARPDDDFVQRAQRIVRLARGEALSTEDLARRLGISLRTLHRRLDESVGITPRAFLERARIELARTLLEDRHRAVKTVAEDAGFRDEATFRRAFRRHTGQTPTAYRAWAAARGGNPR